MSDQLERKLKLKNLRTTTARKVIYSILMNSDRAMSAREVCDKIGEVTALQADSASVYRNLSLFTEIGLTHRLQSGKYSVCQHGEKHNHDHGHEHIHIVASCSSCGRTQEIASHSDSLCNLASGFKSYIAEFSSFSGMTLLGKCKGCSLS